MSKIKKNGKPFRIPKTFKNKDLEAAPIDFILGVDFSLGDDPENNWVTVKLLKGDFAGITYKYDYVGMKEEPKTEEDALKMKMQYTILSNPNKLKKSQLDNNPVFNNIVFNVLFALMQMQGVTEPDGSRPTDIGELDS